jgi:hypothetical integral membrane protein (TIGR02206 family)
MRLLGAAHVSLLAGIAFAAALLAVLARRGRIPARGTRLALGCALAANELVWWCFRYRQEGIHLWNLPLQLSDATLWATVLACLTINRRALEFAYFAGMAGGGMALLTPDLWSPWPSYPVIYFFVAHGGEVVAISFLVFGGVAPLRRGALPRAFGLMLGFAAIVAAFDAIFRTNYMYLRRKPANVSLLDALGPWPAYLVSSAAVALLLFWLLWLAARAAPDRPAARRG